jgi:N-acetylglutamate synthase/N-acetylornithine aminotransferase
VEVSGGASASEAKGVGKAIVNSPLFKCAVAGNDPNVGRLASSIGDYIGSHCQNGAIDVNALKNCTIQMGGEYAKAKQNVQSHMKVYMKFTHDKSFMKVYMKLSGVSDTGCISKQEMSLAAVLSAVYSMGH